MAHFAKLNDKNCVTEVLVIDNKALDSENEEFSGIALLHSLFGEDTKWVQTSYNGNFRFNFAGIGYSWDGTGFAAPQPFPSWSLDLFSYQWQAPVAYPEDGKPYKWDEATTSWVELAL